MAKKTLYGNDLKLTHAQMVELRSADLLNLGINDDVSEQILNASGIGPQTTTACAAFRFFKYVSLGILGYSTYLGFTRNWGWILAGLFVTSIIWQANKKGGSENLLDAAMIDSEFYERVQKLNGWIYEVEESEIDKLGKH